MMCLGLNWDPIRHNYDVIRAADGYKVPALPSYFSFLVQKAMQDSHALVKKEYNVTQAEDILPPMTPNACVVGFYTAGTGKLPLQQVFTELLYVIQRMVLFSEESKSSEPIYSLGF